MSDGHDRAGRGLLPTPEASLRDHFVGLSDAALFEVGRKLSPGVWGASGSITVEDHPVFVKRLPLTDLESAKPYSTRNHFRLPTYYSYGVGSAGMGAWRELAGHQATSGQPGFPHLLHHRVTATACPLAPTPFGEDGYLAYWRGNQAVGRYMQARRSAHHELWIFLEHVPHPLVFWLMMNQDRIDDVLAQLVEITASLRQQGIVHFDAHLANVVTDGQQCRLGDFGLVMASDFELSRSERTFLARHAYYDLGVSIGYLGMMLLFALNEQGSSGRLDRYIERINELPIDYQPALVDAIKRYREPICYMARFLIGMQRPSKAARYDDHELAGMLRRAGVPLD